MVISGNGLISLVESKPDAATDKLCAPMQLDDFVAFVNAFGPQTPKRVTKLDIAFNKQLIRKPN